MFPAYCTQTVCDDKPCKQLDLACTIVPVFNTKNEQLKLFHSVVIVVLLLLPALIEAIS